MACEAAGHVQVKEFHILIHDRIVDSLIITLLKKAIYKVEILQCKKIVLSKIKSTISVVIGGSN